MKSFAASIRFAALASLMLAASQAFAVDCTPGPQCVEAIVVTPGDDQATSGDFIGGAGLVGVGISLGSKPPLTTELANRILRAICKPKGEDGCTKWGVDRQRDCVQITAVFGTGANGVCRAEAAQEAAANCPNLLECP